MQLEEVRCLIQSRALEQVDALEQLDESQRITQATSNLNPEAKYIGHTLTTEQESPRVT